MSSATLRCEAERWSDGNRCPHPAKYLVSHNASVVCGVHRRAFLRAIPLAEIEPDASKNDTRAATRATTDSDVSGSNRRAD